MFTNNRTTEEFEKNNENYNMKNTVYNNLKTGTMVKKNDYTSHISSVQLTPEVLTEEFAPTNPNLNMAKNILIYRIADNPELIQYCVDNNLLTPTDLLAIFLSLIVLYDEESVNPDSLNIIYKSCEGLKKNPNIIKVFLNLLSTSIDNAKALLKWYYNTDKNEFVNVIGNVIHGTHKDAMLEYIESLNDDTLFELDDCTLIQSMCLTYSLEDILKYASRVTVPLPHKKLCEFSLRHKDENVFLHWNEQETFKCEHMNLVFSCVLAKKFKTASKLLETCDRTNLVSEDVIKICTDSNNTDLVKFIVENLNEIDVHCKNDVLMRTMIVNENLEAVQFLFDNVDKLGMFGKGDIGTKILKILRFVNNNDLVTLVKNKINA